MADDSGGGGRVRSKKKKKSIRVFEVMTRVELDDKTRQQYALNNATNEFYVLKRQCAQCSSVEEDDGAVCTTATTSTVSGSEAEEKTRSSRVVKEHNWLSESDYDEIIKRRDQEVSHQRRLMLEKEEVSTRRLKKKLSTLNGMRIHTTTHQVCGALIAEAIQAGKIYINVNCFLIMNDGTLIPYNPGSGTNGCHYELLHNKHRPKFVTEEQLFNQMLRHEEAFKQLLHIFHYLKASEPPLEYSIYKRKIELLDGALLDRLTFWDRLERLFEETKEGYYYAILVRLGFTLNTAVASVVSVDSVKKSATNWV